MTPLRDLTLPLDDGTPRFPGDPAVHCVPVRSLERGDPYRLTALSLGTHSGTHLDAPSHFLLDGLTVDRAPLELLNGTALVVVVPDGVTTIGPEHLAGVPAGTERLLVRSANSAGWARGDGFRSTFTALGPAAADRLVALGVRLVGVDGLSVESDPTLAFPVHHRLLGSGCWILEGLDLAGVAPGVHELGCLPLRLRGLDGAPSRAVLWS